MQPDAAARCRIVDQHNVDLELSQDGACVLDERCGPGTTLQDGACVLDSTPQPSSSSIKGLGKDMVMGVIIAFVGAGVVGIVFALIGKANKSS